MKSYNLSTVSQINVFKKSKSSNWIWKPDRKLLGFINLEAGFYLTCYDKNTWHENPPTNCYLEKGIVYIHPHMDIFFTNGNVRTLYFGNSEDLMKEVSIIKDGSGCNWYNVK